MVPSMKPVVFVYDYKETVLSRKRSATTKI